MKISDDWNGDAHVGEPTGDLGNGPCRFVVVDGDSHQATAGVDQLSDLEGCTGSVGGVCIRHRLHDDRMCRADGYAAYEGSGCISAGDGGQVVLACEQFES